MGCTGQKTPRPNCEESSRMKDSELRLLKMMYDDLAMRSKQQKLTREVFDTFFHLNGLWGQEMFRVFDKNKGGVIDFDQFVLSIEQMVRGTYEERSHLLFTFYDVDKTGGVSYSQFLKMLYSYPKEDIKEMVTDQKFLQSIDSYQLTHYFGPEKHLDDKIIMEEVEQQNEEEQIARKQSEYLPSSSEYIQMQEKLFMEVSKRGTKKQKNNDPNSPTFKLSQASANGKSLHQPIRSSLKRQQQLNKMYRKGGSMHSIPTYIRNKNLKPTNNVASLVKKYAQFIFKQLKIDEKKDEMKFQQFLKIVTNQPKIFSMYFQGFHLYIWDHEDHNTPQFRTLTPWIEGETTEVYLKEKNERYIKYIQRTLFVFENKKSKLPCQIKNMEGLVVEAKESPEYGKGFLIKHRDGIYPQKQFYFKNQGLQKEWLHFMAQFKSESIYNQYQIVQKIGQGNFSSVYRGVEKETNKQVAIKVIEKFKLSLAEKQIIKFQCGILQLCHHPNIVRFNKQFNTKSNIYIVTELMCEGDLFQYTKKTSFLEEYEASIILKQLIEAIQYLNHELGLIHRDLKPENILIQMNRQKNLVHRVKIIDFGFAVYKNNLKNMDAKDKYAGTPGFVAPEVYLQEQFDEGVDMFSLGVIMFFMLCGRLPFYSPIYEDIRQQTIECNISFENIHWMNISDNAKDLLSKILTFKNQRIGSKEALAHPWLQDSDALKQYIGKNKKNRYI